MATLLLLLIIHNTYFGFNVPWMRRDDECSIYRSSSTVEAYCLDFEDVMSITKNKEQSIQASNPAYKKKNCDLAVLETFLGIVAG